MSLLYYCSQKCYELVNYGYMDFSNPKESIKCLFHIFAGVMAAYIAYNRNKSAGPVMAIGMAALAFVFGFVYILYFVAAVILGDNAYSSSYGMSGASNAMLGAYSQMVQNAA